MNAAATSHISALTREGTYCKTAWAFTEALPKSAALGANTSCISDRHLHTIIPGRPNSI